MRKGLSGLLILTLLTVQSSSWADVTLVRTFSLADGTSHGGIEAQGVTKIQGTLSRKETNVRVRGKMHHVNAERLVTVVSLDQGIIQNLDVPHRSYQEVPLAEWRKIWEGQSRHRSVKPADPMHITQSWYKVIPVKEYKIYNGFRCSKFMYVRHLEMVNPDTYARKEYRIVTTQWLADSSSDIEQTFKEENAFLQAYSSKLGGLLPPEDLNYMGLQYATELTGASEQDLVYALTHSITRMRRIDGYPIFSQSNWYRVASHNKVKPLFSVRSELKSVSLRPLAKTVFRISKDFAPKSSAIHSAH